MVWKLWNLRGHLGMHAVLLFVNTLFGNGSGTLFYQTVLLLRYSNNNYAKVRGYK